MKKFLSAILSISLILALAACGSQCDCNKSCDYTAPPPASITSTLPSSVKAEPSPSLEKDFSPELPNISKEEDTKEEDSVDFEAANAAALSEPRSHSRFDTIEDCKAFYDKINEFYLSGEWDGSLSALDGHSISISQHGEILADGFLLGSQKCVDLPDPFTKGTIDSCNLCFVPGQGSYVVIDETYIKYLRGEEIQLPGEPLKWKSGDGIDTQFGHPIIGYDSKSNTMFLWTPMIIDYFGDVLCKPTYLYVFPDLNTSKIEFVGRAEDLTFDDGFKYIDEDNKVWRYSKGDDGQYNFTPFTSF